MSNALAPKSTFLDRALPVLKRWFPDNSQPVVLRADAGEAHEVVYQGKGVFLVRTNLFRHKAYEERRTALEDACHTKIAGATEVRDKAVAAAKAAYSAAIKAANEEYRTVDAVATKERDAAIASLDLEFSSAPVSLAALSAPATTTPPTGDAGSAVQ